jgi:hypothetical protein
MSDAHLLALVALANSALMAWVMRAQQKQLEEMQRLLASRTFAEYGKTVRVLEHGPEVPREPDDGGYAAAFNSPHGHG